MSDKEGLIEKRQQIRPIFARHRAEDARDAYYALWHPPEKTTLVVPEEGAANGYVCLARTGIDLFRPLVTMRLPTDEIEKVKLIYRAIPVGMPIVLSVQPAEVALVRALFAIESEEEVAVLQLSADLYQPLINIFVSYELTPNQTPSYVVRKEDGVATSATINWQSAEFAEISVYTHPHYRSRGLGRSVVSALAGDLLARRLTPLYSVSADNSPSLQLAQQVGFVDTGKRLHQLFATLNPPPFLLSFL